MMPEFLRRHAGPAAFAGTALALFLGVAAIAGAAALAYREFASQAGQYRVYRALQREAGKADSLSADYARVLGELEAVEKALPPSNQSSHVLNALTESARRMDLGLSGVTGLDEIPFPGYTELPFELGVTGRFTDLVRYLHSLETQGMALRVRRVEGKAEALNKARIQAKVELSVFAPAGNRPAVDSAGLP